MDIFGILDPYPHENLCGSETLVCAVIQGNKYRRRKSVALEDFGALSKVDNNGLGDFFHGKVDRTFL